jgi:hypothetical protein
MQGEKNMGILPVNLFVWVSENGRITGPFVNRESAAAYGNKARERGSVVGLVNPYFPVGKELTDAV